MVPTASRLLRRVNLHCAQARSTGASLCPSRAYAYLGTLTKTPEYLPCQVTESAGGEA